MSHLAVESPGNLYGLCGWGTMQGRRQIGWSARESSGTDSIYSTLSTLPQHRILLDRHQDKKPLTSCDSKSLQMQRARRNAGRTYPPSQVERIGYSRTAPTDCFTIPGSSSTQLKFALSCKMSV